MGFFMRAVMPGDDLLFHRLSDSTIGAVGFHGRVRDGIGWDTDAMVTRRRSARKGLGRPGLKQSTTLLEFLAGALGGPRRSTTSMGALWRADARLSWFKIDARAVIWPGVSHPADTWPRMRR